VSRSPVDALERELEALCTTIAETGSERDREAELAEQAATERREAAQDPAAFAQAALRAAEHGDERERLGFVLERRRQELLELERRIETSRYADAYRALEAAAERRQSASTSFSKALAAAIKTLPGLESGRDEYDAALAHTRELRPEDIEFELPENADEEEWPTGIERLVELVQSGPRRPIAKGAAAIECLAHETRQSADTVLAQGVRDALRDGSFARLERLSAHELVRAVHFAERQADELITGDSGDRARAAIERRLKRIRELAAPAEVAA
jgi:hypothetical protein